MKVTVCFGPVRVVVPCGDGDILIRDLTRQAIHRYKKAIGKSAGSWVGVHSLQSQEGGILDPDDRLLDVADDREQIVATLADDHQLLLLHHHGGGDGASGSSSLGTPSPDIFQGGAGSGLLHDKYRNDIEVTTEQIASGIPAPLQVRRGSEPALNQLLPNTASVNGHLGAGLPPVTETNSKRWSAAPIITEPSKKDDNRIGLSNGHGTDKWRSHREEINDDDDDDDDELPPRLAVPFSRDGSNRLSMQFLGDSPKGGLKWADAAERAATNRVQSLSLPRETRRKDPLGEASSSSSSDNLLLRHGATDKTEYIVLDTESGALGIHVVPDYDSLGKDRGLLVQGIEPGGRVDRDGRLAVYDRIVEINGRNLLDQPFHVVQDIFRDSLRSCELRLRVVKHRSGLKKPPPPVYPKPPPPAASRSTPFHIASASASALAPSTTTDDKENNANMVEGEERSGSSGSKLATVSPTKKVPAVGSLQSANTRKIGRKMELDLIKGPHGLGFSITTRDNPAGGNCPIYIKNILPKGAAVEDGRLRPGDRLLAVDGAELTGKSQSEAVAVLRNVPPGGRVRIVVSRQDDGSNTGSRSVDVGPSSNLNSNPPPTVSKQSGDGSESKSVSGSGSQSQQNQGYQHEKEQQQQQQVSEDSYVYPWRQREILTLNIPVHDTEKAGLGVSVKGKTSNSHGHGRGPAGGLNSTSASSSVDLGIFIKNVLHGGAASRDGRLRTNDQLLNVNGISLLGLSNAAAMETLRRAMVRTEGPVEGTITLTVARKIAEGHHHQRRDSLSSLLTDSSANTETFGGGTREVGVDHTGLDNSGNSENSDNTVIFLPPSHKPNNNNNSSLDGVVMRNPVLERLTGQTSLPGMGNLHNESYYRATHQTTLLSLGASVTGNSKQLKQSPTVNQPSRETVIIEEDSPPNNGCGQRNEAMNPKNGIGGGGGGGGPPPVKPGRIDSTSSTTTAAADATYASQLSLEDPAAGFSRDAFGRQSMSEKRHATLDAKNTDTYQRNKKLREERERQRQEEEEEETKDGPLSGMLFSRDGTTGLMRINSAESIPRSETGGNGAEGGGVKGQLGPSLGMKKSSSLESLQTMVQEQIQMAEEAAAYGRAAGGGQGGGSVRVVRGRGCNESFRAAVDRSYDAPLSLHELRMDTLAEDDGECGGTLGPRQSSLDSKLKGKKKQSLLKGIGSMFRFGKHRKPATEGGGGGGIDSEERERREEQYRRLMHINTNSLQQPNSGQQGREIGVDTGSSNRSHHQPQQQQQPPPSASPGGELMTRTERIQQLRAHHQQRHVERRGHYPLDETEERYEEAIRQVTTTTTTTTEQQKDVPLLHNKGGVPVYYNRLEQVPDLDPINRPGSRIGISDPAKFSHYVNYQEIQHHLNMERENEVVRMRRPASEAAAAAADGRHRAKRNPSVRLSLAEEDAQEDDVSRRQQHYHSQRRDNREPAHHRPVSNFYEYESVQAVMRSQDTDCNSLPRRAEPAHHPPINHGTDITSSYNQQSGNGAGRNTGVYPHFGSGHHYHLPPSNANNRNHQQPHHHHHLHHHPTSSSSLYTNPHRRSSSSGGILSNQRKPLGPFVTHVTIRECQQQAAGPKV